MANFAKERADADSNYALAYLMRQAGCLPRTASVADTLELFFMCHSMTMTIEALATVAATLANAGVCPLTGTRVFTETAARNCLSLMASCGHGDASGEFAFRIGLPAKCGSSKNGATMVVVPGVAGFCVWDGTAAAELASGCTASSTGEASLAWAFCSKLVETFPFHCFERGGNGDSGSDLETGKHLENPLRHAAAEDELWCANLLGAAATGDIGEFRRLQLLRPGDTAVRATDYDQRTALHLAAAEGRCRLVRLLLAAGADPTAIDRWHHTPMDDAMHGGHESVKAELAKASDLLPVVDEYAKAMPSHATLSPKVGG